ncbi:PREDICTED: uncharacterized protein LOC108448392 [Corvus brachyrhynchos]|uniref:uncharacterized protein LOC108448392 n=1 Tax=Corvus brachyrhynchos TaxID=85066 RepID=UPI0008165CC7|nr:PREDICTED: uncharacterized protein LOC108448392 [Corvus brachyrhynchos]
MRWSRGSAGGEGGRRHLRRTGSYVNSNGIYKYLESGVGQDSAIHVGTGCSLAWQGRQGRDTAPILDSGSKVEEDHGYGAGASPAQRAGHGPCSGGTFPLQVRDGHNTSRDAPKKRTQGTKRYHGDRDGAVPEQEQHHGLQLPRESSGSKQALGAGASPGTGSGTAGQMLLHPMTCQEYPAMWPPNQKRLEESSHSQLVWRTRERHAGSQAVGGLLLAGGGMGQLPMGWTSIRATRKMPNLTGGKGTGSPNAALPLPCCSLPAQPLCSHHGTFSPACILSWQRMGNDESYSPQPHPARPKETSAAFEVAFKGSQNED